MLHTMYRPSEPSSFVGWNVSCRIQYAGASLLRVQNRGARVKISGA